MNKLNKLYEAMLKTWDCDIREDGSIYMKFMGEDIPVKIDGKQVYLATSENLNAVTIGKIFFHPACESIMSKETEIFKVIRRLTTCKIYTMFTPIYEILSIVANKKNAKTLSSKLLESLEPFKNTNKGVRDEVISIIKNISIYIENDGIDNRLINFTLMKGGKTENDETIYYTATPSFPFYTEIYRVASQNEHLKQTERINFVNLNVSMAAIRIVISLFELVFPSVIDPSRKKYSSTSPDAARLVAYLHSYGLVVSDMNSLFGKFRKEFDSIGIYGINIDFLTDLDEISEIKNLIPSLDYNNYNTTPSGSDTGGQVTRISSFNPFAGLEINKNQQQNNQINNNNTYNGNAPKVPDLLPGETYLGCKYYPNNDLYEFKFQSQNGIRVKQLASDGRIIGEHWEQLPQQQGYPQAGFFGYPMSNIPPLIGIGNNNGYPNMPGMVIDPYTGQFVQTNNSNNNVVNNGSTNPYYNNANNGNEYGTVGVNGY